jgi:hypothetical protein
MGAIARLVRRTAARFIPRLRRELRCSGCDRAPGAGVHLVAGPEVYLCSDCFDRAVRDLSPRRPSGEAVRCRFCGAFRSPDDRTQVGPVTVCAECLGVMDEIFSATKPTS